MNRLWILLLLVPGFALADETIRSTDGESRYYVRDRGETSKAIINDRGEKVGYGVKRGDTWMYFVKDDAVRVTEDD